MCILIKDYVLDVIFGIYPLHMKNAFYIEDTIKPCASFVKFLSLSVQLFFLCIYQIFFNYKAITFCNCLYDNLKLDL